MLLFILRKPSTIPALQFAVLVDRDTCRPLPCARLHAVSLTNTRGTYDLLTLCRRLDLALDHTVEAAIVTIPTRSARPNRILLLRPIKTDIQKE
jgi:hypothetical protein